jgi:hypothetical protein
MPDVKYVTVLEDYYEEMSDGSGPRLIHAAGTRIQQRTARTYGDAIKTKEEAGEAAALPFEVDAPAVPRKARG